MGLGRRVAVGSGGLVALSGLIFGVAVWLREPLSLLLPIHYTGKVSRIAHFSKGGLGSRAEGTRQLVQFAIFFEDGFDCEGYDTSFAAIREGDTIAIRGYHDVGGTPLLDPEWWECDRAQLDRLMTPDGPVPSAPEPVPAVR